MTVKNELAPGMLGQRGAPTRIAGEKKASFGPSVRFLRVSGKAFDLQVVMEALE